MAQPTSSILRAGLETSFLSFEDGPNSPNPAQPIDDCSAPLSHHMSPTYASSTTAGVAAIYQRQQPASPDASVPESGSSRDSPFKSSRLAKLRSDSSRQLAAAAFADASDASNRFESLHASPPRVTGKPPSTRGSRLGALLGRSLQGNDGIHSRNASSSTNQTEANSSNDSSFFGRRNRSKAVPANEDIVESPHQSAAASSSSATKSFGTNTRLDSPRATSAMGMLDSEPDSPKLDNEGANDSRSGMYRPTRPSSQSNLLDAILGGTARNSGGLPSNSAPQQSRGGRLGRLAYKKDDSIAFIAQSRNASHQLTTGPRNTCMEDADHQSQPGPSSNPTAFAATRGLGFEYVARPYISERTGSADTRAYANSSAYGNASDVTQSLDHTDAGDTEMGVASTSAHTQPIPPSSNTSSRAPSVAGMYSGNYHNRFSRQLGQEPSHDSEMHSNRSSADAHNAPPAASRSSYEKRRSSPRGTLSDAAIAELGTMPGASAGSLLNANGAPLSSKNILTIALQKAQNAVQLDSVNNVPEAISAYKQAVRLLEEVMERIAPRNGKRSRPSREEERRRLRVIHDTYADRIRLLSMIYSPNELDTNDETTDTSFSSNAQPASTKADWLDRVRDDSQEDSNMYTPKSNDGHLDPTVQNSPRGDAQSFLSITPVRTAFAASPRQMPSQPQQPPQSQSQSQPQHPWPRSPPMPNAQLSPTLEGSPRHRPRNDVRPGSRDSRSSRASISVSIADEQEAQDRRIPPPVIAEEMPRISIEATTPEVATAAKATSSWKEVQPLRDAAAQVREAEVQQHGRSDSDSSYLSTTTAGRLKPTAGLSTRAFGLDDEVRTPVTPYFDASGEVGLPDERGVSPIDSPARQQKLSLPSAIKPRIEAVVPDKPVERPVKMGLAQRARALSFKGPLLRQKASMPSLGDRRKGESTATINGAAATPTSQAHRPGSAGSPSSETAASMARTDSNNDHPTPWNVEEANYNITLRPGSNRPRASTASALVSPTVSAGTISQRRKNAQISERFIQGQANELEELGTVDKEARPGWIPMSARQRSTSQPGSRRPSIPAAFVVANANASGGTLPSTLGGMGTNGEKVPPPVPDLAQTLSALDLKRTTVEIKATTGAAAAAGDVSFTTTNGGDASISSLAMPLPRCLLDPSSEAISLSTTAINHSSSFLITDIFPSGLPSLAAGAPSYASAAQTSTIPPPHSTLPTAPHVLLRPFFVLNQLHRSMISGAQITPRLYLPSTVWRQAGVKLVSVETKMRAIESLLNGLKSVEKGGEALLIRLGSGGGLETLNANRFLKCLAEWEALLVEVQNSLARKLPFIIEAVGKGGVKDGSGKDGGGGKEGIDGGNGGGAKSKGFGGGFGSRLLTRGLDRMTGGAVGGGGGQAKAVDSNTISAYVDALIKLFERTSVIIQQRQ
uniref:Uncharacterized protein n=1 Tax=Melanopsichium pennsylvanicum 4 TaxID=1398559 RepID=A0A077QXR6_9BASI|nr:hypothetical protein BN887_03354 [Melanopsichium pennsylvanicum 4]